ncbi:hypothetical protein [Iodobacter fluviatilis]|uniref:Uncharacterized protein n=1 Tax=Iodobacter fluviatilis TaxID=537 RepID=A0A7G3G855_9NEIS|nr:hypothetical protein [Iodobacter fluviatilis]QBC43501.1 hypothetical protein C1H71_08100 [Iodobacter fluviatilis]
MGPLNAINGILLLLLTLAIVQIYRLRRKKRYQALLDSIPNLNKRSRFVIVNQAFRNIWNTRDPNQLIVKDDYFLSTADLAANYQADDMRFMQAAKALRFEHNFKHFRDGSR